MIVMVGITMLYLKFNLINFIWNQIRVKKIENSSIFGRNSKNNRIKLIGGERRLFRFNHVFIKITATRECSTLESLNLLKRTYLTPILENCVLSMGDSPETAIRYYQQFTYVIRKGINFITEPLWVNYLNPPHHYQKSFLLPWLVVTIKVTVKRFEIINFPVYDEFFFFFESHINEYC